MPHFSATTNLVQFLVVVCAASLFQFIDGLLLHCVKQRSPKPTPYNNYYEGSSENIKAIHFMNAGSFDPKPSLIKATEINPVANNNILIIFYAKTRLFSNESDVFLKFTWWGSLTPEDPVTIKIVNKEQRRGTSFYAEQLAEHFLKQHELVDDFILCQYNSSAEPLTTQSNARSRSRSRKGSSCTCPCQCRTTDRYKSGEFRNKRCRHFSALVSALCASNEPSIGGTRNPTRDARQQLPCERSLTGGRYTSRRWSGYACPIVRMLVSLRQSTAAVKPSTKDNRGTRTGRLVFGPTARPGPLTLMLGNQELGGSEEAAREGRCQLVCGLSALLILAADQTPWEMGRRFRNLLHSLLSQCFGQSRSGTYHQSVFVSVLRQLTNRFFATFCQATPGEKEFSTPDLMKSWPSTSVKDHRVEQFCVFPLQHQFNTEISLFPALGVSRSNADAEQQPADDPAVNTTSFLPTLSPSQDEKAHLDHVGYRLATMASLPRPLPAGMSPLVLANAGFHFDSLLSSQAVTCHRCFAAYSITEALDAAELSPIDWHRFFSGTCQMLRSCDRNSTRERVVTAGPVTIAPVPDALAIETPQFRSSVVPVGFPSPTPTGQVLPNPQNMGIRIRGHWNM